MRQRLISAAVLVPVVVIVFVLGYPWLVFGIAALAAGAAYETARLVRAAGYPADAPFAVLGAIVAVFFAASAITSVGNWFEPRPELSMYAAVAFFGAVVVVAGFLALRERDPADGFANWVGNVVSVFYPGLLAFLAAIEVFNVDLTPIPQLGGLLELGRVWLLILVLTVWTFDSAAYLAGKYHGRGRFMNHISPNKTWSGVIGGFIAAVIVCAALTVAAGQSIVAGLALAVVIPVFAQAGDLAESMLKRAAGAKDSGNILPGHGGVLDRVDSFLFAAPAMFVTLVIGRWLFAW
jgi:phosphatidate cytidylyltransferase